MTDALFAGLRVLDAGSFIAAPAAATILADYGADVIKVEPPEGGDPMRDFHRAPGMPVSDAPYLWTLLGRSKRSLALDLKTDEGRDALYRLIATADVFVTNMPLKVRERLGISYEALKRHNERLIYASFTGYGEEGAEKDLAAFDSTAWWARSGLMEQVRPDADGSPARSTPGMGDHMSALALYGAIVSALYRREKTGEGAYVSSSLIANGAWSNAVYIQAAVAGATFNHPPPRHLNTNPLSNHYLCADGRWLSIAITAWQQAATWPRVAKVLGLEELVDDPKFRDIADRAAHSIELVDILDKAFARRSAAEWKAELVPAGVNASIVARAADAPTDDQMHASGTLVPMADNAHAPTTVASPFAISGVGKRVPARSPGLGEHNEEILSTLPVRSDTAAA